MPSDLEPAQRRAAQVALAMLPLGGTVLIASVVAAVAVAALGLDLLVHGRLGWTLAWCLFAGGAALWNARAGIAMMSAFDWRPLPATLLLSAAVIAAWLALP